MPFRIRSRFGLCFLLALSASAGFAPRASADDIASFQKDVQPLLQSTCIKCHGEKKRKGGVDFSKFTDDASTFSARKMWLKAIDQVKSGEMPPEDELQLTPPQKEMLLKWMRHAATSVDLDLAHQDPGPAPIRRLNRSEYDNTIHDLLGIDFHSADAVGMQDDTPVEGFATLANNLTLSAALLDKYFAAADKVLDAAFFDMSKLAPTDDKKLIESRKRQDDEGKKARAALRIAAPGDAPPKREAARQAIERFATRAYRRPLRALELDRLLALFDRADQKGESFETSLRLSMKGVLVSPNFLFRVEHDRGAAPDDIYRVSDHELAVRLSYFLWSTMPDDELLKVADDGKLSDPVVLEQQVRRMLKDKRAGELTDNFGEQWLQLAKLGQARPSTEFFPTFNYEVRQAMKQETRLVFEHLRTDDLSVLDLLTCDYTYLNEPLAKHYGIEGVTGKDMRRVQLKRDDHRGGLLSMGSVLALTSHTSRTSPTLRGKYVLEVIFGTPPPPPPPDAGELKDDKKKGATPKTFREQMAAHASQATCAACHRRIDPLGYGLENFNAVGQWRTDAGNGQPLDTYGKLPTGEEFRGSAELQKTLLSMQGQFVRNVVEQMMTYALGRQMDGSDEAAIQIAKAGLEKGDHKFGALILAVAQSKPFQYRKNAQATEQAAAGE